MKKSETKTTNFISKFSTKSLIYFSTMPLLIGVLALSACAGGFGASSKNKAPVYVERPVELLYNEARDLFDRKLYSDSVMAFEEVDRQHPYSEWSRRSILMSAFANYRQSKYEEAISAAQRYISLYQNNQESSAYAYYLIANCYFEQIVDVERDQRMTELALASLNEVVQRYPETAYARDARLKMDMTRDQLAGKEMAIGRYYLTQDQHLAAIGRFKRVVELYQTTSHVPEALHRLVEAYLSLGVNEEATKVGSVLGYNYPGSEWYERSYNLLTSRGEHPSVRPQKASRFKLFKRKAAEPTPQSVHGNALPPSGT